MPLLLIENTISSSSYVLNQTEDGISTFSTPEYNTFLRSRKTARRTLVAIMRPLTAFVDLKPVLFLRQRETWHSGENSENGQSVLRWLQVRGGG